MKIGRLDDEHLKHLAANLEESMICDETYLHYSDIKKELLLELVRRELDRRKESIVIDLEHVVYCKNCKHRDPEDHRCDCGSTGRAGCMFPVDDTYFCAYGEAKDETTE